MALGTEYIIKYLSDISSAVQGVKSMEALNINTAKSIAKAYGEVKRVVGDLQPKTVLSPITSGQFAGLNQQIRTTGQIVQTVNGKFLELTKTQTIIGGQIQKTSASVKDVTGQFAQTAIGAEKANKSFKTMFDSIVRLGARALLTIPIWQALRVVMETTTHVFTDGFKDLINESLALDKVKNTLQGTTSEITVSLEKIKNETQSLALESGISHEKILSTFQKFSSVGLDVATAMAATNAVIKLGVITQSDATASADGFAHALSVLIDTNASAIEKQKQINDIIALTSELWKTNGFSVEEFTGSLEKFAVTSKSVNFTTSQTLALLATLSKSGLGSAGNLLRNSIGQLLVNLDKLAGDLGIKVNPTLDDTFTILMKVLEQINNLQKVNDLKGLQSAKDALKDIFGGTRSAVPITALASLYDVLKKNIALTPDINKLNDSFKGTEGILANVVARFHTANAEIGKAFVSGLLGAEDFNSALDKVVVTLNKIQANSEGFGKIIKKTFSRDFLASGLEGFIELEKVTSNISATINQQITKALNFKLPLDQVKALVPAIEDAMKGKLNLGLGPAALGEIYSFLLKDISGMESANANISKLQSEINSKATTQQSTEQKIANIMLKKADFAKLEGFVKKELSTLGLSEVEVERRILDFRTASGQFLEKDLVLQKELVNHLQTIEEIELKRSRAKGLIDNQLELLKLQGATNVQVVQQRIELEKMFGINQTRADLLRNELELNKEITKEKLNQNKVSSDSLKIFEISQKFGIQKAEQAAQFLQGKITLNELQPSGRSSDLMPIIKEFFASQLEQLQAQEFFFKGQGTGISIPEKVAIQNLKPIDLSSIKLPDINTQVGQINVEIKKLFKQEDTAKQIMDSMLEAIRNNPAIEDAINEKIDNF